MGRRADAGLKPARVKTRPPKGESKRPEESGRGGQSGRATTYCQAAFLAAILAAFLAARAAASARSSSA